MFKDGKHISRKKEKKQSERSSLKAENELVPTWSSDYGLIANQDNN